MSRLAKITGELSPAQERQLVTLLNAGAVDRDRAASVYDLARAGDANPNVLALLRDRGLSDSRTARPQGASQRTLYWLTPAGVERARHLRRSPNA